jgi:hypothetical protein
MSRLSLLAIIASMHPEIYDAIHPHSPASGVALNQVALNPQPLPPRGGSTLAAAAVAQRMVRLAVDADTRGESGAGLVGKLIDEWCGTVWPRKWPRPWPGPQSGPLPDPWDVLTARVTGALVFAYSGARLPVSELGAALAEGAERLAEAAIADYHSSE